MVGSQWSGKVGCFLVFFMIPSGAGNLHSNPDFQIHAIQRWSHLKTWNQSLVILDIPNFNPMKEALWYSHPLLRYLIFGDGPRLYLQKKEWYVRIVRGPWADTLSKVDHTIWERKENYAWKWCQKLCALLLMATCTFGKMWLQIQSGLFWRISESGCVALTIPLN